MKKTYEQNKAGRRGGINHADESQEMVDRYSFEAQLGEHNITEDTKLRLVTQAKRRGKHYSQSATRKFILLYLQVRKVHKI